MENQFLEELQRARNLVVSLSKEVDVKNEKLFGMERKFDETFSTMMMDRSRLQQVQRAYDQGILYFTNSKFVSNSICFKVTYPHYACLALCILTSECVEYMLSRFLDACVASLMTYLYYLSHIRMGLKLLTC